MANLHINLVDKTISLYSPLTQHSSFFRNLSPLFILHISVWDDGRSFLNQSQSEGEKYQRSPGLLSIRNWKLLIIPFLISINSIFSTNYITFFKTKCRFQNLTPIIWSKVAFWFFFSFLLPSLVYILSPGLSSKFSTLFFSIRDRNV